MTIENTPAAPEPSIPSSQPKIPEKFKVKVDGKEMDVTLDELKSGYGLNKTATQRLQEAAKKEKEAKSLREALSAKNFETLQNNGWTEDEIEKHAAQFLIELANKKSMTPEQKVQRERELEYERLKKEKDEREEKDRNRVKQELDQKEAKIYQDHFLQDIAKVDKKTWLDLNDPIILSHIIQDVHSALTKYNYDMPVSDAVKRLEEKLEKKGAPKKEYWKKLSKFANKEIDDSDLDAFFEKGAKGIREKAAEAIKRAEAPFAHKEQTKSPLQNLNTTIKRDADYYQNAIQKHRDLRYRRIK